MGFWSSLFGKKKEDKLSLDEANEINKQFAADHPVPKDDEDAMMRQASGLLTSGKFAESMAVYQDLAGKYPEKRGLYLSQVGANQYFLEDYEGAIGSYLSALQAGMDQDMIDDNVWEACEAIFAKTGEKSAWEHYLSHFPEGNYAKKARKKLGQ